MSERVNYSSKTEMAKDLMSGVKLRHISSGCIAFYDVDDNIHGTPFLIRAPNGETEALLGMWNHYHHSWGRITWESEIPEQGVLCWVWNGSGERKYVELITKYDPKNTSGFAYYSMSGPWQNAKPMTPEEVNHFIKEK